jgi:hypothetical protein
MNGDLQQLMEHIGNNHETQMNAIKELAEKFAEHKGRVEARVDHLEEGQKAQDKRQWTHSFVVFAANSLHHILGAHFGWKF